jgi:hypothetical protein
VYFDNAHFSILARIFEFFGFISFELKSMWTDVSSVFWFDGTLSS